MGLLNLDGVGRPWAILCWLSRIVFVSHFLSLLSGLIVVAYFSVFQGFLLCLGRVYNGGLLGCVCKYVLVVSVMEDFISTSVSTYLCNLLFL